MKPIALDLGLSVRWADRNLGAETPGQRGTHFYHRQELSNGHEETEYFNNLIKKEVGKRWRLPTIKEILELERCSWQIVSQQFSDDRSAWREGANKVISYNKKHFYLHSSILVAGLAFFSFNGKNDKPGIFITDPNRNRIYNSDVGYYSKCFYSYNSRSCDHSKHTPTTIMFIRPVTDEMPTIADRLRQLSEEDVYKNYKPYPQKPIPLSIERISDYTEEQYRQYQEWQRKQEEWQDQYWARKREEEEERKRQELKTGRVYHKVDIMATCWKGNPYNSQKKQIIDTALVRHDELMALIGSDMSAKKSWLASHSNLFYEEIIDVEISYNLHRAYDNNGELLSDNY